MNDDALRDCRDLVEAARYAEARQTVAAVLETATGATRLEALELDARCSRSVGRYEAALEVLDTLSREGPSAVATVALTDKASIYRSLARYHDAFAALTEADALAPDRITHIRVLSELANVYAAIGDAQRAELLSEMALADITQEYGDAGPVLQSDGYALMTERRLAVARLAQEQGQHLRALYFLEWIENDAAFGTSSYMAMPGEASGVAARLEQVRAVVDLLSARSRIALGEMDEAVRRLEEAAVIARRQGDVAIAVQVRGELGRAAILMDNASEAATHLSCAVEQADEWLLDLAAEQYRTGLREALSAIYANNVTAAAITGDGAAALEAMERARGREFLLSIRRQSTTDQVVADSDDELAEIERRISAVQHEVAGPRLDVVGERRELLRRLLEEKQRMLEDLRGREPRRVALSENEIAPVDVVSNALADTALIEYFVAPTGIHAVMCTEDRVDVKMLGVRPAAVAAAVDVMRAGIAGDGDAGPVNWEVAAAQLAEMIWDPLMADLGIPSRICVVPHGPLHGLPFSALISNGRLVLETHEVVYAPSASILTHVRKGLRDASGRVAVFANPRPYPPWDLPAADDEAAAIAATTLDVTTLRGAEASVAAFRAAAPTSGILHVASHAEFDRDHPLLSGLLLASSPDSEGKLHVYDIYRIRLGADLVILSACETGRADVQVTGELESLVRAFIVAGSDAVIGSLWSVNDPATAALMTRFYNRLASGSSVGTALRESQRDLAQSGPYRHPYYWAAFGLYGNWQ